ncbi:MAG: preprotein translocase subunit SecE [Candidatus Yonathbacteria bacterium]|nr:preprotein translocase subunit SecE [Candidatus Yonathbacteria bacterium]
MKGTNYFKEVRAEMKHVSWPTKKQVILYTVVVIVISLVAAYYLGLLDALFARGLDAIITQ